MRKRRGFALPELRKDPILNRWVIIATERAKRPTDYRKKEDEVSLSSNNCPLCPGHETMTPPEVSAYREPGSAPNTPGWWVRVVPNKFPALDSSGELQRAGIGMYDMMNGLGAHEVIIETTEHVAPIALMTERQIEEFLWVYRDRMLALRDDSRLKYVLLFKNYGKAAGASLEHPHAQLIATPIVPKRVSEEVEGSRQYYTIKERCIYCDIVKQEISSGERVVWENSSFVSFAPYASRFPFETWIVPKKHEAAFTNIDKNQIMDLAGILKETLGRIHKVLLDPPFNFVLHTAPFTDSCKSFFHWHIEVMPRLTQVAGFEWGTGMYINPTPPEEVGKALRGV